MDLSPVIEQFGQEDQRWLASADGTDFARSVTFDISKFTPSVHYPNGFLPSGIPLAKITATGLYGPYIPDTNEVQTVTVTGGPTGGTFTLTWSGQTTGAIAFNATAAAVQAALAALSNVDVGNVSVTGASGGPYTVTFVGSLFGANEPAITATPSLTGGTSPGVTITSVDGGAAGASNGQQTLVGFLFTSTNVIQRNGSTPTQVSGALLDRCKVVTAKLPIPVDAAGKAAVAGQIIFI